MGIIRSQSIKSTIITYIGFSIGAINMMFVMPRFFSKEQIGLTQVFVSFAQQVVTIGSLGMAIIINKFLPYYRAHLSPRKRDLFTVILIVGTLGMLMVLGLAYLNYDLIVRKFTQNSPLFVSYMYLFPLFAMGYFYYSIFESFNNNYKFTVWSSFVREIFYRCFNLSAALFLAFGWLTFKGVMNIYVAMYWLGALLLAINLSVNKLFYITFHISKLTKRLKRNIAQYSLSSWGTSVLGVTFQFVDTFAIAGLRGLGSAAVYSMAKLIISPIVIPTSSVINISIPLISDAWRRNDLLKIEEIYKKTALVLMLVCGFAFFLIWTNASDILSLVPARFFSSGDDLSQAKYVILILGFARAIDFSTSVNTHILQNSRKYYWVDLGCNILTVVLSIPLTYFLTKNYGIVGAATTYLALAFTTNVFKAVFLYKKEHIHPFSGKWIHLIFVFLLLLSFSYLLDYFAFNSFGTSSIVLLLFKIGIKTIVVTSIFVPVIYALKISDDINSTIKGFLSKLKLLK